MISNEQINKIAHNLNILDIERKKAINALQSLENNKSEFLTQHDIMEYHNIKETCQNLLDFFNARIETVVLKFNMSYPMHKGEFDAHLIKNFITVH